MSDTAVRLKKIVNGITVLAGLALPITGYLIYLHFKPEASSFCNINSAFSCEIVNQSEYAELFGIPVSILGFLTYVVLVALSAYTHSKIGQIMRGKISVKTLLTAIAGISGFGTLFSLYLTYAEAFLIKSWCILCVTQQIIILVIFILSMVALKSIGVAKKESASKEGGTCEFC